LNKKELKAYYEALHNALERELVEVPDNCKELRECCRQLETRLKRCPDGEKLIAVAKSNIHN
jgi:hypothetical protein